MADKKLWSKYQEIDFFTKSLEIVSPEQLFYTTKGKGFLRFDSYSDFKNNLLTLLKEDMMFFAGMKSKNELGKLIEVANKQDTYEKKAEKFLNMMMEVNGK